MAYNDFEFGLGANAPAMQEMVLQANGSDILLPDTSYIRDAELVRDGMDLVLKAENGQITVENYFALETAPTLNGPDGSVLTPKLVHSFVKSGGEYASNLYASDESPVGAVQEITGEATVTRTDGSVEPITLGTEIYQGDIVETAADGAVNIIFVDETNFAVSEDARLSIDEFVYDPSTESGQTDFSVLKGMFVYTSGLIGRDDPDDVTIDTPVGSIGIRGTIIAGDVDQGEITVVEGAIVLRDFGGNEVTLANQFETARFDLDGTGIEFKGAMPAADVATKFASVSNVSPTLFSSIQDAAQEQQNESQDKGTEAEAREEAQDSETDTEADTEAQGETEAPVEDAKPEAEAKGKGEGEVKSETEIEVKSETEIEVKTEAETEAKEALEQAEMEVQEAKEAVDKAETKEAKKEAKQDLKEAKKDLKEAKQDLKEVNQDTRENANLDSQNSNEVDIIQMSDMTSEPDMSFDMPSAGTEPSLINDTTYVLSDDSPGNSGNNNSNRGRGRGQDNNNNRDELLLDIDFIDYSDDDDDDFEDYNETRQASLREYTIAEIDGDEITNLDLIEDSFAFSTQQSGTILFDFGQVFDNEGRPAEEVIFRLDQETQELLEKLTSEGLLDGSFNGGKGYDFDGQTGQLVLQTVAGADYTTLDILADSLENFRETDGHYEFKVGVQVKHGDEIWTETEYANFAIYDSTPVQNDMLMNTSDDEVYTVNVSSTGIIAGDGEADIFINNISTSFELGYGSSYSEQLYNANVYINSGGDFTATIRGDDNDIYGAHGVNNQFNFTKYADNNFISTYDGDDTFLLNGINGGTVTNNIIFSGTGDDTASLNYAEGNAIFTDAGDDLVEIGPIAANNLIVTSYGNDTIIVKNANNDIFADSGDDYVKIEITPAYASLHDGSQYVIEGGNGNGFDTLALYNDTAGTTIDFSNMLTKTDITEFEHLKLYGGQELNVTLSVEDVFFLTGEYGNELFITSNDVEAHNLDLVDFTDIELSALQDIDGDEVAEVFDVYKGAYDGQEVVLYVEQTINETATAI